MMKARTFCAIERGTKFGHQAMAKYDCLKQLSEIGVDMPKTWTICDHVILMDYIGNSGGLAPHLNGVNLNRETANRYCGHALDNVESMLSEYTVHGDLTSYNIPV